jgi:hypothetical protein
MIRLFCHGHPHNIRALPAGRARTLVGQPFPKALRVARPPCWWPPAQSAALARRLPHLVLFHVFMVCYENDSVAAVKKR